MNVFNSLNPLHREGGVPVSGGGQSEDKKVSYGFSSLRGKRASMEDFHDAQISQVDGVTVGLFGVFDGHGGSRAADYVKQNLFKNLRNHSAFVTDTRLAIAETYNMTDQEYLKADDNQHRDAGSTASTAVLVGDRLLVANVGDSRAVLCTGGKALPLSTDHKPNRHDERERIEKSGGVVMWSGTWRVGGVLAVSRAFGDRLLKKYVVAEPEIQEKLITKEVEFLLLASDGLWDVVSNQDAVAMVKDIQNAEEAAKRLTEEAYEKGSADNITCVVIRFHHDF
jgi:protein phosphatase 1L